MTRTLDYTEAVYSLSIWRLIACLIAPFYMQHLT